MTSSRSRAHRRSLVQLRVLHGRPAAEEQQPSSLRPVGDRQRGQRVLPEPHQEQRDGEDAAVAQICEILFCFI